MCCSGCRRSPAARSSTTRRICARTAGACSRTTTGAPHGKLTVSAGLRYDYASPPVDKDDRANLYDFATGIVVPVGTDSMPRGGFEPDRNNISPRVGFAWTLDDLSQWVVRGGYGIYYNQGALATSEGLFFNPPYFNLGVVFPGRDCRR